MNTFKPAHKIQDLDFFGENGGVNPSISDSATYTFLTAKAMADTFEGTTEGCYLYSRHSSPSNTYLGKALAAMENTEAAHVTASGMGAISATLLQLCSAGDEIISSRTVYGGTYALMKNFMPKFHLKTKFVNITNLAQVEAAITDKTKVLYCESLSNPLLELTDIEALAHIAQKHNLKLVVDNTFSPLLITPANLGADVVIHSLTKYINGTSDGIGGVICGTQEFIQSLLSVNDGACMLLGPTLDSFRAANMLKNLRSLHVRMKQHSANAYFLAQKLDADGYKVVYPGLEKHPQHQLFHQLHHPNYGYGGMMTIDAGDTEKANRLMEMMQDEKVGYLAVSLGFYKTLFNAPGSGTSSEIPEDERLAIGLTDGLIRMSIGLDADIEQTYNRIKKCMDIVAVPRQDNKEHLIS